MLQSNGSRHFWSARTDISGAKWLFGSRRRRRSRVRTGKGARHRTSDRIRLLDRIAFDLDYRHSVPFAYAHSTDHEPEATRTSETWSVWVWSSVCLQADRNRMRQIVSNFTAYKLGARLTLISSKKPIGKCLLDAYIHDACFRRLHSRYRYHHIAENSKPPSLFTICSSNCILATWYTKSFFAASACRIDYIIT